MMLKKMIFIGIVAGIPFLLLRCNNDNHSSMHDRMMEDGHMGSGGMMGDRQGMRGDTVGSGQQEMMGNSQRQAGSQGIQQPLTLGQAQQRAEEYLLNTGNTSLKIGEGIDRGNEYEFPLTRKSDGERVASLLVDKSTGEVRSQR